MHDGETIPTHKFLSCDSASPALLSELLQAAGIDLPMSCGGNHHCGKCKIRVCGDLSPLTAEEGDLLSPDELREGFRLACFSRVTGTVRVEPATAAVSVLSAVTLPPCRFYGEGYGLAVDVGTTTIAAQLYALSSGKLVGEALAANRQGSFGADVISRIEFSNKNGGTLLEETLHQQLTDMGRTCMEQAGVVTVEKAVLTGNTTMLHFWEKLDPRGIAVSPFTPASLFGTESRYPLQGAAVQLPPCVGAYVGGDILCAVLSSGMLKDPSRTSLLVDLGTNGELALFYKGKLLCASTAMGPAFEGANLSAGMPASPGAVFAIESAPDGTQRAQVIGDCDATGICGSGVLDAVRVMLESGCLDETGLLCGSAAGVCVQNGQVAWRIPGTELFLTQQDIRQVQLAKAAVYAGIQTLLAAAGLQPEALDCFYIAGGFGHHMNLDSATRAGLFPALWRDRTCVLGNAALSGAAFLLLDKQAPAQLREIHALAEEYPLSGNRFFSEQYMESMLFEDD